MDVLESLGLNIFGPPVGGRPGTRGNTGCVIRWGEGWFEEVRETLGWEVERHDDSEVTKRVDLLLHIFSPRQSRLEAILDGSLAIMDS